MGRKKSVCIFYFSGTGNTKYLVGLVQKEFREYDILVNAFAIDDLLNGKIEFPKRDFELFGFMYPIYSFDAPSIVYKFIKKFLPRLDKKRTFIIKDCGDPIGKGGSTKFIRKCLKKKGYDVFHETMVIMPANVLLRYEDEFIKKLCLKSISKVSLIVSEVLDEKENLQKNNLFLNWFTWVFSRSHSACSWIIGKDFSASKACIHCNRCVKNCPVNNIYEKKEKIRFGFRCLSCMRCIYICPVSCISPFIFGLFKIKPFYNLSKLSRDINLDTKESRKMPRRFYKYLES